MISEKLQQWAEIWIGYKMWLVDNVGLTNDALHVHGSLLILCLSAIILRRRPDSIWCWLIVLIAELFNEFADLKGMAPGEDSIDASIHDIYNTMFWPTVLLIMGRLLFPRRQKQPSTDIVASGDFADEALEHASAV